MAPFLKLLELIASGHITLPGYSIKCKPAKWSDTECQHSVSLNLTGGFT